MQLNQSECWGLSRMLDICRKPLVPLTIYVFIYGKICTFYLIPDTLLVLGERFVLYDFLY